MTTEATATVVEGAATTGGDAVIVELPPSSEPIETPPSDFVQVAEIEANKEITIAAIEAETEQARIDAQTEGDNSWQEDARLIREQVALLSETVTTMASAIQSLTAPLTQPISEAVEEVSKEMTLVEPEIIPAEELESVEVESPETEPEPEPVIVVEKRGRAFMI